MIINNNKFLFDIDWRTFGFGFSVQKCLVNGWSLSLHFYPFFVEVSQR